MDELKVGQIRKCPTFGLYYIERIDLDRCQLKWLAISKFRGDRSQYYRETIKLDALIADIPTLLEKIIYNIPL